MKELFIKLETINDVKDFVNTAVSCPCEIYLFSGRYIVDGKSIMGVFSLDLTSPIRMELQGENAVAELESFRRFEIKG